MKSPWKRTKPSYVHKEFQAVYDPKVGLIKTLLKIYWKDLGSGRFSTIIKMKFLFCFLKYISSNIFPFDWSSCTVHTTDSPGSWIILKMNPKRRLMDSQLLSAFYWPTVYNKWRSCFEFGQFKVPFELMNGLSQHEYCLINDFGLNARAHPNKIFWNSFYIKGMLTIIKFHKTFKSLMMQDPWLSLYWLEYLMKIEEEWLHSLAMDCPRLITILCIIIKVMTWISNWCINKCFNLFSRITMVIYRWNESVNFLEIWTWPWCLTLTFLESWPWTWPLFHWGAT